ncbi:nitronate monooxygenase [Deinococcus sp. MIMF12]|uniref:Nitronate monooxygenase n=1 Tax=Deinococcus rhizophilus TaxID=3049544 RepID=A0ABT7JEB6_9DEIO|nr:nitronate monooxygenase [Deinococcus rhizophilus]MDL2343286.1 nitronate monooxygenase [Deinococcus rhizophilus]
MTTLPHSSTTPAPQPAPPLSRIIQGGMGVAISNWVLAQSVSRAGQLGVVSGTGIDNLLVRRLQDGDPGGHVRRALGHFPDQEWAGQAVTDYYLEGGRTPGQPYKRVPLPTLTNHRVAWRLAILGSFVEVFLAREGHASPVGLNLLTKLQLHTMPAMYGAMLAGVDTVIMGAGIPREVPGALDAFAQGQPYTFRVDVKGDGPATAPLTLDPADYGFGGVSLPRPKFYPIISSHVLAGVLTRKATGSIQGFVIEGPTAGGHNAPPRGQTTYDASGQPVYGERDLADLAEMRKIGLPFWLAGGSGSPEALRRALDEGAAGIQVGTLFAYCAESGLRPETRDRTLAAVREGQASVYTDPLASPTGFPFKVVQLPGTLSEPEVYAARTRVCDIGYLREFYWQSEGKTGLRCAAEPVADYVRKGGAVEDTIGRKCLCNALMADAGQAQIQKGGEVEQPLITSGDDLVKLAGWKSGYSAGDVIRYLLGEGTPQS